MLFLAVKNLFEHPVRLLISVSGVALAVMLIVLLWGIMNGVLSQAGAMVRNTDAQVWVVQKGFTDMAHGYSVLPETLERRLERIEGVRDANPITAKPVEIDVGDESANLLVVGYDTKTGVGGPWAFKGKERTPKRGELVVDEIFASTHGLDRGDTLELPDRERKIAALSAGTNQFTNQLSFGPIDDVRELGRLPEAVNFYALRTQAGREAAVQRRIERRFDGVSAFSKPQFLANNESEIRDGFQPILIVMVTVAFMVGLAVVGLTIYTTTIEKSQEYGVMTAIGAGKRALNGVILRQAGIASTIGLALGCALVFPVELLIGEIVPKTEVELSLALFGAVGAASIAMALLASYVPIRRIARLDPAAVFRG